MSGVLVFLFSLLLINAYPEDGLVVVCLSDEHYCDAGSSVNGDLVLLVIIVVSNQFRVWGITTELKQGFRKRLRERHFKKQIRVAVITSRLFLLFT